MIPSLANETVPTLIDVTTGQPFVNPISIEGDEDYMQSVQEFKSEEEARLDKIELADRAQLVAKMPVVPQTGLGRQYKALKDRRYILDLWDEEQEDKRIETWLDSDEYIAQCQAIFKQLDVEEAETRLKNLKFLREHGYPLEVTMADDTVRICVPHGTAAAKDIKTGKVFAARPDIMKAFETVRQNIDDAIEDAEEKSDEKLEVYPTCPRLPGALADLASALFPSLPWEFKFWSLVTRWGIMRSGLDYLVNEPHIQPRFYTILVGEPNTGKTGAINESKVAIDMVMKVAHGRFVTDSKPCVFSEVHSHPSINSGEYLAKAFSDAAKAVNKAGISIRDDRARILIDPDEASNIFEIGKSSLSKTSIFFPELLKLHSSNRISNETKKDGVLGSDKAHLGILASTTIQKYPMLWTGTGGGADGLASRVLAITSNAPRVPPSPLPTLPIAGQYYDRLFNMATLPGQAITIGPEATEIMNSWWNSIDTSQKHSIRILEAVKQLVIVLAVTSVPDGYSGTALTVGPELMQAALEFGKYELAVREKINPADSFGMVQAHENLILAWAKKHTSRTDPKSMNDFRRGVHPERHPGGLGSFLLAWKNCTLSGALKKRKDGQKGPLYSL